MASRDLKNFINSLKGISGCGNILAKLAGVNSRNRRILDPGDYVVTDPDRVLLSTAPIAYDLWYLHKALVNLLEFEADENTEDGTAQEEYFEKNLSFFPENLPGIKPMRVLKNVDELVADPTYNFPYRHIEANNWRNKGVYYIELSPYEFWNARHGMQYASDGPTDKSGINNFVGYFTFPIGQLGVMEIFSIVQETELVNNHDIDAGDMPISKIPAEMFPPREGTAYNKCYGTHIIESGYLIPGGKKTKVEYLSSPIPTNDHPHDERMGWFRYWFEKDDVVPVPGEFIGVLVKPFAIPPHVWWFQESSPFVYAGHWMETLYNTSGIITEVIEVKAHGLDYVTNLYRVKVHGFEIIVAPSDFFPYQVNDRVGIVKKDNLGRAEKSFTWKDIEVYGKAEEGSYTPVEGLVIAPLEFYSEEGEGL